MPDDDDRDRDDTTTANAPVLAPLVAEEEVPTKVTAIPFEEIARLEAEMEARKLAAREPVLRPPGAPLHMPGAPLHPPSPSSSSAIKMHAPAAGAPPPAPASQRGLPAPPPTDAGGDKDRDDDDDDNDDSIVTMQVRAADDSADATDDSIVTVQNPPPRGVSPARPGAPQSTREILATTAPLKVADVLPARTLPRPAAGTPATAPVPDTARASAGGAPSTEKTAPPKGAAASSDIYDAEDDRTERRDIPTEEIERAISRAKVPNVSLAEISITQVPGSEIPDESPTARRQAPGPYSNVPGTLPALTLKKDLAAREPAEPAEPDTTTELSDNAKRALKEAARNEAQREAQRNEAQRNEAQRRAPFGSDSDVIDTEPRRNREAIQIVQSSGGDPAFDPAERAPGPAFPQSSKPPLASPSSAPKMTMRLGSGGSPSPGAPAPAMQPSPSDPSIEAWPFPDRVPESGPRLQAVIPMKPASGGKMQSASPPGGYQNSPSASPPGGYQHSPSASPPGGYQNSPSASPPGGYQNPAFAPTAPAMGPPGASATQPISGSMNPAMTMQSAGVPSVNMIAAGLASGSMQAAGMHGSVANQQALGGPTMPTSMPPPSLGQPIPFAPGMLTTAGGRELAPSEPRWIVLVLVVLAVCIGIPAGLYFVLRPSSDDAHVTAPHKQVTPVETSRPFDIGKRPR